MPFHGYQNHRADWIGGFGPGEGKRCESGHLAGRGRERRSAGREHDAAALRLATLAILAEQPGNGLAVMQALAAQGFCPAAAEASSVYPTLSLLTDMGMISAGTGPAGRTVYTVLDEGAAVLAANRPLIDAIMAELAAADGRSPSQGRGAGRRWRHCRAQQVPLETAPAA